MRHFHTLPKNDNIITGDLEKIADDNRNIRHEKGKLEKVLKTKTQPISKKVTTEEELEGFENKEEVKSEIEKNEQLKDLLAKADEIYNEVQNAHKETMSKMQELLNAEIAKTEAEAQSRIEKELGLKKEEISNQLEDTYKKIDEEMLKTGTGILQLKNKITLICYKRLTKKSLSSDEAEDLLNRLAKDLQKEGVFTSVDQANQWVKKALRRLYLMTYKRETGVAVVESSIKTSNIWQDIVSMGKRMWVFIKDTVADIINLFNKSYLTIEDAINKVNKLENVTVVEGDLS